MDGPGRPSAASLAVASVGALPERPDPPSHLTDDEAAVWRDVVATKPADWFMRDSQPVLCAYCQAVVMHRVLSKQWYDTKNVPDKDLVGMVSKTANLIAQLATKLRLTQQSRYTTGSAATANKRGGGPLRPWETGKAG